VIATKYAGLAVVVLAISVVPVVAHQYVGWTVLDDRPLALDLSVPGMHAVPAPSRGSFINRAFATNDWTEQRYEGAEGSLSLYLIRSFDAKRLYHHPELALLHGRGFEPAVIVRGAEALDVPVRVLTSTTGIAAYTLVFENDVVDNALRFQLRQAGTLLLSPRRPMTLVLAHHLPRDASSMADADPAGTLAATVAVRATRRFLGQLPSPEPR
jgi:hypothetical protein